MRPVHFDLFLLVLCRGWGGCFVLLTESEKATDTVVSDDMSV